MLILTYLFYPVPLSLIGSEFMVIKEFRTMLTLAYHFYSIFSLVQSG